MRWQKSIGLLLAGSLLSTTIGWAEGEGASGASFTDLLQSIAKKALQETANEKIEELSGKTKGHIEEVKLLERRGNMLILEVHYSGVKRHDGVFIRAEVLAGGEPLPGFKSSLGQVRHKNGTVKVIISKTVTSQPKEGEQEGENEWGIVEESPSKESGSNLFSDQIKLYMIREEHPEKKFGVLLFDLPKNWTDSDQPDVNETQTTPQTSEEHESVSLEEDGNLTKKPVFIPAGVILKPKPIRPVQPGIQPPPTKSAPQVPKGISQIKPLSPAQMNTPFLFSKGIYSLYQHAKEATWRSSAGKLPFPGKSNDHRGFVRLIPRGHISANNATAIKLIETHPEWKKHGWINGTFPPITLKTRAKFKTTVGFLHGSHSSGAIVTVALKTAGKVIALKRLTIRPNTYHAISLDLSPWKGKTVQPILAVSAGDQSAQDWVVWVFPKIVAE